jgi:hypothetical protein
MTAAGLSVVEPTSDAEHAWQQALAPNPVMTSFLAQCTPGYYNNEGHEPGPYSVPGGYSRGAAAYFTYIDAWRNSGEFTGLAFR